MFQDGQIAQAIDNVYLNHDVLVFSSAGNRNGESYADTWVHSGFHDFDGGQGSTRRSPSR